MNKPTNQRALTAWVGLWVWSGGTLGVCILGAFVGGAGSAALWPEGWISSLPWGLLGGIAAGRLWSHAVLPKVAQGHRRLLPLAVGWGALSGLGAMAVIRAGVLAVCILADRMPSPAAIALGASCPPPLALPGTALAVGAGAMLGLLLALAMRPRWNPRVQAHGSPGVSPGSVTR
jgi:hypothetical protein